MEVVENVAKKQRGNVDRISELPDFILHTILSRLDTKEAGRASVLSKKWYGAWSSIPVLNFQPGYFKYEFEDDTRTLERFVEFVDKTMQRYITQKYRITIMYLTLPKVDEKLGSLVHKCIMIAVQNQVERLEIQITGGNEYRLPEVLFCAKSLKYLKCGNVGLPYYATIELISLEYLILVLQTVDEDMLQEIISFCPLVELDITYDNHLNKISLPLIRKVNKEVEVRGSGTMQSNLQASQLQKFVYCSCCRDSPWPWNMNVVALKNLRKMEICWASISDDIVSVLASGLTALESLVLDSCSMLQFINISSNSLKELQIINYLDDLKNVTIDAPNLREFLFKCKVETSLSLIKVPDHCNAQFFPLVTASITNFWFVKLKKFLTKTNLFKSLELNLACTRLIVAEVELLRNLVIGQPYKLRELKLRESTAWDSTKSSLMTFLDGLFWCCHPDVLSITTKLEKSAAQLIVSILREKVQCWKDPLKSIEVECIESPHLLSYLYEIEIRLRLSW
ncbi:F-box protein At3g62430-like isoform X2 [Silene latifolia]|uniref:F-box protein At3g62430-like isoform X2 n=1 Tax=Silene latifolia TaxID=37657 RepID=UPI003D771F52